MNYKVPKVINFEAKEDNMLDFVLYFMSFNYKKGGVSFKYLRIVDIVQINNKNISFRFIDMNKRSRYNYTKFYDSYTEFLLNLETNIIIISSYCYFSIGDSTSKECFSPEIINISNNIKAKQFFLYLYKKYMNMNKIPNPRM
jgi:hypothetical protein